MRNEIQEEVVLVASMARRPHDGYKMLMSRLDIPKAFSNRILHQSLKKICKKVHYYNSIEAFTENLHLHRNHVVFPYYYAVGSRINNSYVQSICESNGIRFVGPESYALTVCNDKVLSKDICRAKNLKTPNCAVIYSANDKPITDFLSLPLIVKPVFEGNSIGITSKSVCSTHAEALRQAKELYQKISAPVMIEEFIAGTELNICMFDNGAATPLVNTVILNKSSLVYDYSQKHRRLSLNRYPRYQGTEIAEQLSTLTAIFTMLGKVEFMRIDCIVSDGEMRCIELTPDADLSINSALYKSFQKEMKYVDFLRFVISNSLESYRNR